MLDSDIRAEREAIACYTRILRIVRDEKVCAVITEIRADEERHLAAFEEMRRSLCDRQPTRDPQA